MAEIYPPVGFHFRVDFLGASSQSGDSYFQSVSGLSVEVEYSEAIKEGGENRFKYHLPTGVKYNNLTLQRGMSTNSDLTNWCFNAFKNFEFEPADLIISLLNENHTPLKTWNIKHALPVKWSVSDFNAEENSIVIESLELSMHYFDLI